MCQCHSCLTKPAHFLELQRIYTSFAYYCILFLHYIGLHCVIIVLSYVFNWMFLFLVTSSCSFVAQGSNLLYKCKGIMFPLLPVSTLCGTVIEIWFDDVFRFSVNYQPYTIENNRNYIHCVNMVFFMVLVWFLFQVMDGSISPASADLSKVFDLATLCTPLPIGQALSRWMAGFTITATLASQAFWHMFTIFSDCFSAPPFYCFTLSDSFVVLRVLIIADWALQASTHFVQASTCSLVTTVLS